VSGTINISIPAPHYERLAVPKSHAPITAKNTRGLWMLWYKHSATNHTLSCSSKFPDRSACILTFVGAKNPFPAPWPRKQNTTHATVSGKHTYNICLKESFVKG
jgi:hypothetical protein